MDKRFHTLLLILCLVSGFTGAAVASLVFLDSQAVAVAQDVVLASGFVLVDSTGVRRAELSITNDNRPVLRFYDAEDHRRMQLMEHAMGYWDDSGMLRGTLGIADSASFLALYRTDSVQAVLLRADSLGASMHLTSNSGTGKVLSAASDAHTVVYVMAESSVARLGANRDGASIRAEQGKASIDISTLCQDQAIMFQDTSGVARLVAGLPNGTHSQICIYNPGAIPTTWCTE